jgi:hypothetical protein
MVHQNADIVAAGIDRKHEEEGIPRRISHNQATDPLTVPEFDFYSARTPGTGVPGLQHAALFPLRIALEIL